jgi:hypothetical protein
VHLVQISWEYPAELLLVAVTIQGAEFGKFKSAEAENIPPQFPASKMEHVNGQFIGSGFAKVVSASRSMISPVVPGE